jgi:glycosyltransferase involved in cell wall biosynthesis
MIPAYNCSCFLKEAIESVLQQDPGEDLMQIEVVDDCSTDADVEQLVKETGKGRVTYYRQCQNMGSLRNFETCINRSRGHYVHLLHGDDRVKHGFYEELTKLFETFPDAGAAFCAWSYINNEGKLTHHFKKEADAPCLLDNWLYKLAIRQRLQYVAIAVKREVYEQLGSFYGVVYGEDWEMWARIAKYYSTAYTPKRLAEYREHSDNSISKNSFYAGNNIKDIVKVIDTISSYLPLEDRQRTNRLAKKHYVHWAMSYIKKLWRTTRNKKIIYHQLMEITRVHVDAKLAYATAKLLMRIALDPLLITSKKKSTKTRN